MYNTCEILLDGGSVKEIIRQKTVCFTGHRLIPIDHLENVKACTEIQIRRLILKHGIRYFGVGGAIGYDTLAAEILFRLRETDFPHIKVILVYPFEGFTSRWNDNQRAAYARLYPKYDKHVCVTPEASREAYLARDRHLVDNSAYCICYCTRQSGGTAYTVRYARRKGLSIYNTTDYDLDRL